MAYDVRLVKLINGELVLGKFDAENDKLTDLALIQTVPTEQGVQMMLLPFGYPFDQEIGGEVSMKHVLYQYKNVPEELTNKYFEASSNLTMASANTLRNLNNMQGKGGGVSDISDLLKK
ncbi:hypothetical protein [Oceanidesulfovibrio marinus]|uniref:Uncharacterized protein n=1 Tax=Oceanidesulfovibrio marinus TaxID=370038 RepID=A0A6P1ZN31_9BACT|nr:hypothetical protein [Oceanidesulfovibrio marinus]QJT08813.1 hypothetical protein E8L03_07680 [Oceanidesulfovibrio marinus]TVM36759.1 hypothetical protein DQK91_02230 [Oceanidesulfovibrio marinus]